MAIVSTSAPIKNMSKFQIAVLGLLAAIIWLQYEAMSAQKTLSVADVARYQLIELSNMRRDRYMVDTKTGRTWQVVCQSEKPGNSVAPEDCPGEVLEPIQYIGDYALKDDPSLILQPPPAR